MLCMLIIHTIIHNWSIQPVQPIQHRFTTYLVSQVTYVVRVNFIREWQDLQFDNSKPTTNDRFLGNFFMAILLSLKVVAIRLLTACCSRTTA